MSVFNILLLICIMFTVVMGIIVFMRNPRNKVNQIYGLLSFLVALSGFVNYYISLAGNQDEVYALLRMTSLRLFIFPVTVQFYLLLTKQNNVLKGNWLYVLLYLFPTLIMFTTDPRSLFDVVLVDPRLGWNFYPKNTIVGSMMIFYIFSLSILLFYLGIRHIVKSKERQQKMQGVFVLTGFVGALMFPVFFDIALPLFAIAIPQISSLSFILGYILIAYAIIRFDLFAATPESATEDILKNISDAVILTDRLDNITFVNEAAENLFGFDHKELAGRKMQDLFVGTIPGNAITAWAVTENESLITRKGVVAAIVSQTSLFQHKGKLNGYAYVIREITELKNLIDRLAESEARYKNIFENIQNVYFESSPEGIILEISPSISNFTAYSREDLIGSSLTKLYAGSESREQYWKMFLESPDPVNMEVKLYNSAGELEDGMLFVKLLRNPDGSPLKLVGNVTNISAVKKAEKLQAESEERYRLLFEKSPEGILLIKDLNTSYTANEAAMQILGIQSVDDFLRVPAISFIHPDDRAHIQGLEDDRAKGMKEDYQGEIKIVRPDDSIRDVFYLVHEIHIGEETYLQIMVHDVTDRVEAQKKLIESEKRYSLLVETSPDSISLVNEKFEILMANSQTAFYTGIPVNQAVGQNIFDFFSNPLRAEDQRQAIQKVFDTGEIYEQHRVSWNTVVGQKWFSTSMVPLKNEHNKVDMVMIIYRDITQIEEAEQKIRRNEEVYRLFLENFQGIAFRVGFDNKLEFLYGEVSEISGYTKEDFKEGIPKIRRIIHPEDRIHIIKALRMLRRIPNSKVTIECRILHQNGGIKYIRLYLQNIMDEGGKPSYLQAALFDKTDYYDLQNKIINSIIETEDRERQRFAEDLHDELGPLLSSVRIYINLIQTKAPEQEKEREELIEFAKQLLDEAVIQTKSISYNLMPEVLNQYGFIPSIKSYCGKANISEKVNITIRTDGIDEETRFDNKLEIALYRVVKELINNTLKHSGAENIKMRFFLHHQKPALEYSDDGQGFNVDQKIQSGSTLGVRNIFHRIQSVNGTVNFSSVPNQGVKVLIKF